MMEIGMKIAAAVLIIIGVIAFIMWAIIETVRAYYRDEMP